MKKRFLYCLVVALLICYFWPVIQPWLSRLTATDETNVSEVKPPQEEYQEEYQGEYQRKPSGPELAVRPYAVLTSPEETELGNRLDIFEKVVVKYDNPVVLQDLNKNDKADVKLRSFDFVYVFDRKEAGGKTYVQIARDPVEGDKNKKLGWIDIEDVYEWLYRCGYRPQYSETRSTRRVFFSSAEDAHNNFKGSEITPVADYEVTPNRPQPTWLITDMKSFDDGKVAYEVCAVCTARSGTTSDVKNPYTDQELKSLKSGVSSLDVVFLLDGTGSMQPAIENVKSGVAQIAQSVANFKKQYDVDVKFGLVVYRDFDDEKHNEDQENELYEFTDLQDLSKFLEKISEVKANGGGDNEERGFIAAQKCLNEISWRDFSTRRLIVVGDYGWHMDGASNPEMIGVATLERLARKLNVHISVLAVERKDLVDQLKELSISTGGETRLFENIDVLANDLADKIQNKMDESKLEGQVFQGLANGEDETTIQENLGITSDCYRDKIRVLQTKGLDLERVNSRLVNGEDVVIDGLWFLTDKNDEALETFLYRFEAESVKSLYRSFRETEGSTLDRYEQQALGAFGTRIQQSTAFKARIENFANSGLPYGAESILAYTRDEFYSLSGVEQNKILAGVDAKEDAFVSYLNDEKRWNSDRTPVSGWIPDRAFP